MQLLPRRHSRKLCAVLQRGFLRISCSTVFLALLRMQARLDRTAEPTVLGDPDAQARADAAAAATSTSHSSSQATTAAPSPSPGGGTGSPATVAAVAAREEDPQLAKMDEIALELQKFVSEESRRNVEERCERTVELFVRGGGLHAR